jgi:hypothetical protein
MDGDMKRAIEMDATNHTLAASKAGHDLSCVRVRLPA